MIADVTVMDTNNVNVGFASRGNCKRELLRYADKKLYVAKAKAKTRKPRLQADRIERGGEFRV